MAAVLPGGANAGYVPTRRRREYRCSGCGYGIVVRQLPDRCAMCRGTVWEQVDARPRAGEADGLTAADTAP
jgi:rubredoxin